MDIPKLLYLRNGVDKNILEDLKNDAKVKDGFVIFFLVDKGPGVRKKFTKKIHSNMTIMQTYSSFKSKNDMIQYK
jgi:hypothetical protein